MPSCFLFQTFVFSVLVKKIKLCRYCRRVICILLWKICLYSLWRIDPAVSNQPASYDESTFPWGWFVTSRNIFKHFYLHGYQSFAQTVYLTNWPRSCWICTYKIRCCAINIKGVMMVIPKPCRTTPLSPMRLLVEIVITKITQRKQALLFKLLSTNYRSNDVIMRVVS